MMKKSNSRVRLSFSLALLASLGLALLVVSAVQAHANLVHSDPASGAILTDSPPNVRLEFSEALDPALSQARLVDSNLTEISGTSLHFDPTNNQVMLLDLPSLDTGAYSVVWQARSAVDGHVTDGIVAFSVGTGRAPTALLSTSAADPTTAKPPLLDTLLRWLNYLSVALAAGSLFFGLLVWRPAYTGWDTPDPAGDQVARRTLVRMSLVGMGSLVLFSLLLIIFQAWEAGQGAFPTPFGKALLGLLWPPLAWDFWLRVTLGILSLLLLRLPAPGSGDQQPWLLANLFALGVLLTYSLQSHAAALRAPLPILLDWLHISAMAAWLGGLLPLFWLLRRTPIPADRLVPSFSRLALISVGTLALSGLYSAYLHLGNLAALVNTVYGQALGIKTLLFLVLIGFGATNLLLLTPRLKARQPKASTRLGINVRFELALGALLLAAVGVMTGVSPARDALLARQQMGYIGSYRQQGVEMDLWVAPRQAGDNTLAVDLRGLPNQQGGPPSVLLRLKPLDASLGESQVEAQPLNLLRYTVQGSYLSLAGRWQVEVIVRRPGENDITHNFQVQVEPNPFLVTLANPVPATQSSIQAGQALYESNCLPCHGPTGKGDGPAGLALRPPPADLTIHTKPGVHPDGQLFEWISNGYPGSAMPAFASRLSEEQRWQLVNYIRTLALK
jgi:copper transport protein